MNKAFTKILCLVTVSSLTLTACDDNDDKGTPVVLEDHSITPAMVKKMSGFENLEIFSLISTEDDLVNSPNFTFGGSADGAAFIKTTDGFSLLTNHEDNYAVSRVLFDKTLRPLSGEYILN